MNVPRGENAQIATVEERLVVEKVGVLNATDLRALNDLLRTWLQM